MKYGKKFMAAVLSAAMVASMAMPVFAADEITAPIISFDVETVVMPTSYAMVFNPEERDVTMPDGTDKQDQILSRNYGILNKSSKDKVVTVELTVNSQNDGKITFVDDVDSVSRNEVPGDYKIYLAAIPADATEVQVAGAAADKDTTADDVSNVDMTAVAADKMVAMKEGSNTLAFKLEKATFGLKSGEKIDLDTVSANNIGDKFEVTGLAANGKSITAFTFGGKMNENADWSQLKEQVKITPVYTFANATGDEEAVDGTGAMVKSGKLTLENGVLTAKIKIADFKSGSLQIGDAVANLDTRAGAWGGTDDAVTFTFNQTWADAMKGKTCIATVILQDGSSITQSFNVPN